MIIKEEKFAVVWCPGWTENDKRMFEDSYDFTGLFSRSGLISYLSRKGFGAGKRAIIRLIRIARIGTAVVECRALICQNSTIGRVPGLITRERATWQTDAKGSIAQRAAVSWIVPGGQVLTWPLGNPCSPFFIVICFQFILVNGWCAIDRGIFEVVHVNSWGPSDQMAFNPLPGREVPLLRRLAGGMVPSLFYVICMHPEYLYFGFSKFLSSNAYREDHARNSALIGCNGLFHFQLLTGLLHTNKWYDRLLNVAKFWAPIPHLIGLSYRLLVCKSPVSS